MKPKKERLRDAKAEIAAHWAEHGKAPVCAHLAIKHQLNRSEVLELMKAAAPAGKEELTERQKAALLAIAQHWEEHGKAPTCLSVARIIGIKRSGAQRLMDECRDKGFATGPMVMGHWELSKKGADLLREMRKSNEREDQ